MEVNSSSLKNTARLSGLLYLLLVISGVFGIMYIPTQIIVSDDSVAAAQNILSHELLFRTAVLNDIVSNTIFLVLVLVLYRLFKEVNTNLAQLMVALVIVQIPFVFMVESLNLTSLMLVKGEILKTLEISQRQELAMLLHKVGENATLPLEMFWGLWLLPFGLLVIKSNFIPRIFGILLLIAGIAYMIDSTIGIVLPKYSSLLQLPTLFLVAAGEISITFWLLIKGVKTQKQKV